MSKENIDNKTEELIDDQVNLIKDDRLVKRIDKDHIEIDGAKYEVIEEYQESIDLEKIEARYTDFFEKFHYIVGDISKDQLRLKGFYDDSQSGIPIDLKISYVEDYLAEYCSYGCPYFILKRVDKTKNFQPYSENKKSNSNKGSKCQSKRNNSSRHKQSRNKDNRRSSNKQSKKSSKSKFKKKDKKQNQDNQSKKQNVKTVKDQKGKAKFKINKKQ